MTRLERKFRTDIKLASQGGMHDLMDNAIKEMWRINDDEYDFIAEQLSDNDMDLFVSDYFSIADAKHILMIVNDLVFKFRGL